MVDYFLVFINIIMIYFLNPQFLFYICDKFYVNISKVHCESTFFLNSFIVSIWFPLKSKLQHGFFLMILF